ncbi:MAG: hypothetical protein OXI96_09890 [Acidimicrobiaceae bacterium]|nr:hypothetical protein [Acidimicrobiaceae bacterium]
MNDINVELVESVLEHITIHPEQHDQRIWGRLIETHGTRWAYTDDLEPMELLSAHEDYQRGNGMRSE